MIQLFRELYIETHGRCNRKCPTCLRQNHPDKIKLMAREKKELSEDTVQNILNQAKELGFKGLVGFNWFNEPLLDKRIVSFIEYAKGLNLNTCIFTNGDLLTPELARKLDVLDMIHISFRENSCKALFKKTRVFLDDGPVVTTHYSSNLDLGRLIAEGGASRGICPELEIRMPITCTGEMALCCDDITCEFELGSIYESSLTDLWFSPKHQKIVEALSRPGGRYNFEYCRNCPR